MGASPTIDFLISYQLKISDFISSFVFFYNNPEEEAIKVKLTPANIEILNQLLNDLNRDFSW